MDRKTYYDKINELSVNQVICDAYLKANTEFLKPIQEHFGMTESDVRMELRRELPKAGITVKDMALTIQFIRENCTIRKEECEQTLHEEVLKDILYASIYFTNIQPGIDSGEGVADVISPEEDQRIKVEQTAREEELFSGDKADA